MTEVTFDGITFEHTLPDVSRHGTEFKGGGNALTAIAGIAVSIAVPFLAPTVAGAIFGTSVMGGVTGAILAGGVGAAMGAAGAYLTGNDPLLGAVTGGLGAGAVQGLSGLGMFGSVAQNGASGVFGAPLTTTGLVNLGGMVPGLAGAPAATGTMAMNSIGAPTSFAQLGQLTAGATPAQLGTTAASLAAPAVPGAAAPALGGVAAGTAQQVALTNAAIGATPQLLGMVAGDLIPPSEASLAADEALKAQYEQQQQLYDMAVANATNISPELMAQNLANQAQLKTAQLIAEGDVVNASDMADPNRQAGLQRRALVSGSQMSGTGYMQGMMEGQGMKDEALARASMMQPDWASYAQNLSDYGSAAERKRNTEMLTGLAQPFANAFTTATNTSQTVPNIYINTRG